MKSDTILIVDDDESIRDLISSLLVRENYQTLHAVGGHEALECFHEHHPSLVVSDVEMPEMDGFQLLSAIKADIQYGLTPVILMSGAFTDLKSLRFGLSHGADDYLLKPFDSTELVQSVKARLRQHARVSQKIHSELDQWKHNMALMLPHELNTPLTGILGCAECILDEAADHDLEEIGTLSKTIISSGNRLHRLIKNFLFYIQLTIVKNQATSPSFFNPGFERVPHNLINQARELEELYMRSGDLFIEIKTGTSFLLPDILHKIMSELLDNAFKFSKPGSTVKIVYETTEDKTVLEVSDQGHGFDSTKHRYGAFEQFNRKQQEQQGLGLGLYITQNLAESTQGALHIDSRPGKGTLARVEWPIGLKDPAKN